MTQLHVVPRPSIREAFDPRLEWLSTPQVATILGVSRVTAWRWMKNTGMAWHRGPDGRMKVSKQALEAWMGEQETAGEVTLEIKHRKQSSR